jgi:hypothetical protein
LWLLSSQIGGRAGFRVVAVDRHPDQIDDIPRVFMELELKKEQEKAGIRPLSGRGKRLYSGQEQ